MLSWKEKVAEKLSSLLGDSPFSPSHADLDSTLEPHQAMPLSTEQLSSPKKSTFASFLSYFPTRNSVDNGRVSNSSTHTHGTRPLRVRSLPRRWKASSFKWKDAPLVENADGETGSETDEVVEISKGDLDDTSERNISGDNHGGTEKAPTLNILEDSLSCLTEQSTFINVNLYEFFESSLPNIVKGCRWVLLYSTLKHGISLRTLLRRSVSLPGPCLLIVGDTKGAVFGGLLDSPLRPTAKRKYQGTNNTFVFTTIYGEPRLFRATGANRYYYLCVNDALAFGGGGNFALCLDEDLLHGTSGPCETFGNLCLAHSSEFELKNVELWGFSHSLRSLA